MRASGKTLAGESPLVGPLYHALIGASVRSCFLPVRPLRCSFSLAVPSHCSLESAAQSCRRSSLEALVTRDERVCIYRISCCNAIHNADCPPKSVIPYVPRNKRRRATPRWTSAPRTATAWDDAQRLSCAAHEHTSLSLLLLRPPACCLDSEAERCQYSKSQRTRRRKRAPRRLPAPISAQKRLSLRVRLLPRPQEQGILRITPSATMGLVQIPEFLELSLRVQLRTLLLLLPPLRRTPSRTTPTPPTRPQRSRRDPRRN